MKKCKYNLKQTWGKVILQKYLVLLVIIMEAMAVFTTNTVYKYKNPELIPS